MRRKLKGRGSSVLVKISDRIQQKHALQSGSAPGCRQAGEGPRRKARKSVLERQKGSHASLDPPVDNLVHGQLQIQDEIRGVPRRQQCSLARDHLVARTTVIQWIGNTVLHRDEQHRHQVREEFLRIGVLDLVVLCAITSAFDKKTIDVYAIWWSPQFLHVFDIIKRLLTEGKQIDFLIVLACVILHGSCEERLWEENAADPNGGRRITQIKPHLEELTAGQDVEVPTAQWFQGQWTLLRPQLGHLVDEQHLPKHLKIERHHNETLDRLPKVHQSAGHLPQELVVTEALLLHNRVHRLLIHRRELLFTNIEWERLRQAVLN
mmetsp:Transcript_42933/g.113124  ORF Transcript_42933/g.113124 Transcript_42933/m.113124 type:complete len:321 (-) Transcript_42933:587-1549(-)